MQTYYDWLEDEAEQARCEDQTEQARRFGDTTYSQGRKPMVAEHVVRETNDRLDLRRQLEAAVALSLYSHNEAAMARAEKIYSAMDGECWPISDLEWVLKVHPEAAVLSLSLPSAVKYLEHAIEKYGREAKIRVESDWKSGGRERILGPYPEDVEP